MENLQQNTQQTSFAEESNGLELKKIIYKFLQNWKWFALSVFICLLLSFVYLRYATPVYNITSEILIKDDAGSGGGDQQDLLSQLDIFNTQNNVNDEKAILQTYYLLRKVVDEMQLNVSYFTVGNIKSNELYKKCPFRIKLLYIKDSVPTQYLDLNFPNSSSFSIQSDSINQTFRLYDTVKISSMAFVLEPTATIPNKDEKYQVVINTANTTTEQYLKNISFDISDKLADVIDITLQEPVPAKGEDILNKVYEVYTKMNEDDKNKTADSTISFIDERLAVVSRELSGVENDIENFKVKNQLSTDMTAQATLVLTGASDVQKQIVQQDVQIDVLQSIEDHLKSNEPHLVPNAASIADPTYISTVQVYNTLVLERDRQLQTTKPDNPLIKNLNSQIDAVKKNLIISLENIKRELQIAKNQLVNKNDQLLDQIKTGPEKERVFLDISRQQDVKQQLYLYLLQKREETAISKSGTQANSRLIEPGKSDPLPFKPQKSIFYLAALFLGILIPSGTIYLKDILNNTITDNSDITKLTSVPILGEIGHNESGKTIVAEQNSRTALAEQFRALRTNLQFLLKGKEHSVVMITSSTSGEGKSFLTLNLGSALAISDKKVVVLELDLRKPKISKALGIPNENGFTDYLISKCKKEEIIRQTTIHPNLFLISSGTIPPNPAELLLGKEVDELFEWLKAKFDYIIVDTPPIGVVIDAVLIGRLTDASVYIVRQNYTLKQQLQLVNDSKQNEKLPNLSIVINDVHLNKRYGYGYSYGYGYGYGNNSDYYSDGKKRKRNVFRKKNKI
ncbi:MAG: polysaccharide biosynthesis tyrosine autokinase [Parafilimonas sp.]